jgi:hypothetical protein
MGERVRGKEIAFQLQLIKVLSILGNKLIEYGEKSHGTRPD